MAPPDPPAPPAPPVLPAIIEGSSATESVEVRWWQERPLPPELRELCRAAAAGDAELEHRIDTYLRHCGRDMAVKLRGGDLVEIKQRCGAAVARDLVAGVAGRVEHWRKWSFGCTVDPASAHPLEPRAEEPSPHAADATDHWVPVAKSRCLVGEGPVSVEISEIRSPGRLHWTLAIEAPVEDGVDGLRAAAEALGLGRFSQWFGLEASASYAAFVEPPPPSGLTQRAPG